MIRLNDSDKAVIKVLEEKLKFIFQKDSVITFVPILLIVEQSDVPQWWERGEYSRWYVSFSSKVWNIWNVCRSEFGTYTL